MMGVNDREWAKMLEGTSATPAPPANVIPLPQVAAIQVPQVERKVAIVDIDDVIYPWVEAMAVLSAREGITDTAPQDLMAASRTRDVWRDWGIPQGAFDFVWEQSILAGEMWGVGNGFAARPVVRSVEALWKLSDREWHIHLVTHRLNKFRLHDQAVLNTTRWLKWANIPYRSLSFTENKHFIYGDAIIDDNPSNLVGHPAPTKILYPSSRNQMFSDPGIFRPTLDEEQGLYPWDEIVEILGDGRRNRNH